MKNISDVLLVGFDSSNREGKTVLLIGRKKPNKSVEPINLFTDEEAIELYNRLIGKKE